MGAKIRKVEGERGRRRKSKNGSIEMLYFLLRKQLVRLFFALALIAFPSVMSAHPEDELCLPGESFLDPALCEELMALDRPGDNRSRVVTPMRDDSGELLGVSQTLTIFVGEGVDHILPGGLDHILFVLALFLSSTTSRSLVIQISVFTLAHTITLGLAATGVISPPSDIVEPLIALSIALVAIENLFFKKPPRWRPIVIFLFGLLHGLGFAGFFGGLGLPEGQFWSALIGFNIGVEIGQLSVIILAIAILSVWRWRNNIEYTDVVYRRFMILPGSFLIGATGSWWAMERVFLN